MHINITVPARLDFLCCHEELLIKFLIKLIKDQASFGGYKGAVRIGIFLIPYIHDRLALFVNIIHHADKILLIIPVIPIAFCHDGFYLFQRAFHDIMHNGNRDLIFLKLIDFIYNILTNMLFFILCKLGKCPVCTFPHSVHYLLNIERLKASILLDHHDLSGRLIDLSVFCSIILLLFISHFTYHAFL